MYKHPDDYLLPEQSFSANEVGFKHPIFGSFVRICDQDGSIQIAVGREGNTAIVLDENGVTIIADKINLITGSGGLRWNNKEFNPRADHVAESALIDRPKGYKNPIKGLDKYGE